MATSQVVPTETKQPVIGVDVAKEMNSKPEAKPGFVAKFFEGKYPDPNVPGTQILAGVWAEVPCTVENISALANVSGKGGKPLQDKNFSELTGIYKLAFDAVTNLVRRTAVELTISLLDGPAVKINKLVETLMKQNPKLTRERALVHATMIFEDEASE